MPHLKSTAALVIGWSLCAATLAPLGAQAQPAQPRIATRDELRACMKSEDDLKTTRESLDARNRQNGVEAKAITAEADELTEEQKRVEESTMPLARDRFDRKVRQHNARIAAAKEKEDGVRSGFEDLKKAMQAHNDRCGGMAFRPEDKAAIVKERESQGK
jgi:hypothetical protein